jgi:hypothetical protein
MSYTSICEKKYSTQCSARKAMSGAESNINNVVVPDSELGYLDSPVTKERRSCLLNAVICISIQCYPTNSTPFPRSEQGRPRFVSVAPAAPKRRNGTRWSLWLRSREFGLMFSSLIRNLIFDRRRPTRISCLCAMVAFSCSKLKIALVGVAAAIAALLLCTTAAYIWRAIGHRLWSGY